MAGVVRRDGLRKLVELFVVDLRANGDLPIDRGFVIDVLARLLDAVPDVPPTEDDQLDRAIRTVLPTLRFHNYTGKWAKGSPLVQALSILSEHVGEGPVEAGETVDPEVITAHSRPPTADVPPDPPAADRDELARWLHDRSDGEHCRVGTTRARLETPTCLGWERGMWHAEADALLSSGVLVDAADVRARARRDALTQLHAEVRRLAENLATESNWGGLSKTDYDEFLASIDFAFIDVRDRARPGDDMSTDYERRP